MWLFTKNSKPLEHVAELVDDQSSSINKPTVPYGLINPGYQDQMRKRVERYRNEPEKVFEEEYSIYKQAVKPLVDANVMSNCVRRLDQMIDYWVCELLRDKFYRGFSSGLIEIDFDPDPEYKREYNPYCPHSAYRRVIIHSAYMTDVVVGNISILKDSLNQNEDDFKVQARVCYSDGKEITCSMPQDIGEALEKAILDRVAALGGAPHML